VKALHFCFVVVLTVGGVGCSMFSNQVNPSLDASQNALPAAYSYNPPSTPVLYVFAHQDDEILILAKMRLDVKHGRVVHAVWITDGGKGGDSVERERESRAVMKMTGVPDENLHFLGFPDQNSARHIAAAYTQVLTLVNTNQFAELVTPAYEGGNIDHDVAALIGAEVTIGANSRPLHVEYPLYNRYQGPRRVGLFLPNATTEVQRIALDDEMRAFVLDALKVYRSQRLGLWLMELGGQRKQILDRGMCWRKAGKYDFLKRPVEEPCDYERSLTHRAKFSEWQSEVTRFFNSKPEK
jgi:LmbE family N-acetylglucosaminyl deacetylase